MCLLLGVRQPTDCLGLRFPLGRLYAVVYTYIRVLATYLTRLEKDMIHPRGNNS